MRRVVWETAVFRRPRSFFVVVAVAFAAAAIGVVLFFRQQALAEVIRSQEAQNVVLTRALANVVWPRFAGHVKGASPARLEDLRASAVTGELNREIAAVVRDTPVHRVKVYNAAGLTVFSSNSGQIGESRAGYSPFRMSAEQRIPVSTMSFRDSFAGFSRVMTSVYLVETYIPIEGPGGELEGVFELYTEANAAVRRVGDSVVRFGALVAAGMALLYGVMAFALRRVQRGG
jgi:hypothetical protein